jgi:hypothetical protein
MRDSRASGYSWYPSRPSRFFRPLSIAAPRLIPRGFSNRDLREYWATPLGEVADDMARGQRTYHLQRLRLHGSIERIPGTHHCRMTKGGGVWRYSALTLKAGSCASGSPCSSPRKLGTTPRSAVASTRSIEGSTHGSRKEQYPFGTCLERLEFFDSGAIGCKKQDLDHAAPGPSFHDRRLDR